MQFIKEQLKVKSSGLYITLLIHRSHPCSAETFHLAHLTGCPTEQVAEQRSRFSLQMLLMSDTCYLLYRLVKCKGPTQYFYVDGAISYSLNFKRA